MCWPHLNVVLVSRDDSTGHGERKKLEVEKGGSKTILAGPRRAPDS